MSAFCAAAHAVSSPLASAHAWPLVDAPVGVVAAVAPAAAASPPGCPRRGPAPGWAPVTCSTPEFKGARPAVAVLPSPVAGPPALVAVTDVPVESAVHVTAMPVEPLRADPRDTTPAAVAPASIDAGGTTAAAGRPTASTRPCRLTCSVPEISISPPLMRPSASRPCAIIRPEGVCSTRCCALSTMRPSSPTTAVVACSRPAFLTFWPYRPMRRATTSPKLTALPAGALTSQDTSGARGLTSVTLWPAASSTSPSGEWMRPEFSTCGATR